MDTIRIKDGNDNIILYIDDNNYFGYIFASDGSIRPVDESVFNYFNIFKLSSNNTELSSEDGYRVILDKKTNFKHYFKDGKEDFIKFYLNNGESAIMYYSNELDRDYKDPRIKRFKFDKTTITSALTSGLCFVLTIGFLTLAARPDLPIVQSARRTIVDTALVNNDDLTLDFIKGKIYSSPYLTQEEKDYLYNEDYFTDILPYINKSVYAKLMMEQKLNNLDIKKSKINMAYQRGYLGGYYDLRFPNNINITDYDSSNFEAYKARISHEFAHLCQQGFDYDLLTEACAEIMSREYFTDALEGSYNREIKILRTLIEIIGPEAILEYYANGNFKPVEDAVKPYLSNKEYRSFLSSLNMSVTDISDTKKENELIYIMEKIYRNKFNVDPNEDDALIALDSPLIKRYYFNKRMNVEDNSYYYEMKYKYTIKMAMDLGYITLYQLKEENGVQKKVILSYEDYVNGKYDQLQRINVDYTLTEPGYIAYVSEEYFYLLEQEKTILKPYENGEENIKVLKR